MAQGAIMLDRERAVMAANTATTGRRLPDGTHPASSHTSRICMLPHMGAALVFRGDIALGAQMHSSLLMSGRDDIDEAVRTVWPHLDDSLQNTVARSNAHMDVRAFEAILAGWSRERDAMVGYAYTPGEEDAPGTLPLLEFVAALPGTLPGLQEELQAFEGLAPSAERVVEVIRRQVRVMAREACPESGVDGDACVVEIGREGMSCGVWQGVYRE